ncbi:MAG TPA: hypothetical protein VGQ46_09085 [Thermoanaerobaculia bacterium]|jgi:hypothetical protein|nr:hypothetical protein [Thermoanaerobaculia bacterium]
MTKITFWNVYRLGGATDADRKKVIENVISNPKRNPDLAIYCELNSKLEDDELPEPQNCNYRKQSASQLCYGAVADGENVDMDVDTPAVTPGYKNAGYKGGNDFKQLCDRAVASLGVWGGASVFTIHAPSSAKAERVMAFIGSSYNAHFKAQPWLIVGDFNVEPDKLAKAQVGINMADLIRRPAHDIQTFRGKKSGKWKVYDYVLTNISSLTVNAYHSMHWDAASDHSPIMVEF